MRIAVISPFPPARDGIGDYAAAFVAQLRERGHEVAVIAAGPADGAPAEVIGAIPVGRRERRALVQRLAAWDPDVVHLQFAIASYGARLPALARLLAALRALRARRVVTLHEVTRDTETLRSAGRAIYRHVAGFADVRIVHTAGAGAQLHGPVGVAGASEVLPHPRRGLPDATATARELRDRHGLGERPVLLSFGFIHVDKGLDDLVSAFARWRAAGDPVAREARIVVAGAVRQRRTLFKPFEVRDRLHLRAVRRTLARHGLTRDVVFAGYVPAGEVRGWFEAAQLAVLPYRRIEQSGVAHLAAAAGTPMLISDAGGLAAAADTPWSFRAGDAGGLAAALEAFFAAPAAPRGGAPIDAPDLPEIVDRTLALYEPAPPRQAPDRIASVAVA